MKNSLPAVTRAYQRGIFLSSIYLSATIAVIIVWAVIVMLLINEREHILEHTKMHVTSAARVMSDHTHAFVRSIDVVLLAMQNSLSEEDLLMTPEHRDAGRAAHIERIYRDYVDKLPELDGLYVINAEGNYLFASTPTLPQANVADRPHFQLHKQHSVEGLYISQPVISKSLKKWSLLFTRRLNHADGSFAGMVAGTMVLSHFGELYQNTIVDSTSIAALYDQKMHLLARIPMSEKQLGKQVNDSLLADAIRAAKGGKVVIDTSPIDAVERMRVVEKVKDFPLYTIIGEATASYEAQWREHLWIYSLSGTLTTLMLLGFANFSNRQVRKELANAATVRQLNQSMQATVSELRLANQEQARLTDIINSSEDAIISKRPDGTVLTWNQGAELLFGYTAGEIVGKSVLTLFPPECQEDERNLIDRIIRGEHLAHYEAVRMHKDGRKIDVSISMSPVRNEGDEVVAISAIMRDISERKRIELQRQHYQESLETEVAQRTHDLLRRTNELETANKDLEGFSYSVSHDLRAPLRAIDGFIAILQEDYAAQLDAEAQRLFGIVSDNARKMGHLIDDILAFSRAGRLELEHAAVDMNALVDEIWASLAEQRGDRPIQFKRADLPIVKGDPRALRQVWQNLIGNAIKFSRDRQPARIEVSAEQRDDMVWFTVKDNGAGFNQEYQNKLFGLFQRLHGMDEFEGTGVGLAIVKRFIQKHGGQVMAEGAVGAGATFRFGLPDTPEQPIVEEE